MTGGNGIAREQKRVATNTRKCIVRQRERWQGLNRKYIMSYLRGFTLRKKKKKDLYRLFRQRNHAGKDVQQVGVIKDREGNALTSEEIVLRILKEHFEELMNEEIERQRRVEEVVTMKLEVGKISKDEVRKALKRIKNGKAVGPDDMPVEVWKCQGERA